MVAPPNAKKIRGVPVAPTAPTDAQVLVYSNANKRWEPGSGSGTGNVQGQASSIDGEVALFSGTGGKTIKRATGSGIARLTSGVMSADTIKTADIDPSVIQTVLVTLTPTQIKAMRATPVTLVGAPGTGKHIDVISILWALDWASNAYAGGGTISFKYGSSATALLYTVSAAMVQSTGGDKLVRVDGSLASPGDGTSLNQPINAYNAGGSEYTSGDSPMNISVCYRIVSGLLD